MILASGADGSGLALNNCHHYTTAQVFFFYFFYFFCLTQFIERALLLLSSISELQLFAKVTQFFLLLAEPILHLWSENEILGAERKSYFFDGGGGGGGGCELVPHSEHKLISWAGIFFFFCTFMNALRVIQASVIVSSAAGSEASCSY